MSATSPVSSELALMRELVADNRDEDGALVLAPARTEVFVKRLHLLHQFAASMEHELGVYRIGAHNRAAAGVLEDVATAQLRSGAGPAAAARSPLEARSGEGRSDQPAGGDRRVLPFSSQRNKS